MSAAFNSDDLSELEIQLRKAFRGVPYPGDDRLVELTHNGVRCSECADVLAAFRGRPWDSLSIDFLVDQEDALALLTVEAFRFYLPAFLIAACRHRSYKGNCILESILTVLAPRGASGPAKDWLLERAASLTPAQSRAILSFLEFTWATRGEEGNATLVVLEEALAFWRSGEQKTGTTGYDGV